MFHPALAPLPGCGDLWPAGGGDTARRDCRPDAPAQTGRVAGWVIKAFFGVFLFGEFYYGYIGVT
jgi:hypothetical protein